MAAAAWDMTPSGQILRAALLRATDRSVTDELCEGAADLLLRKARLDGVECVPVLAAVRALGWRMVAAAPKGYHGVLDPDSATIFIDGYADEFATRQIVRHELGHLAGMLACVAHDESDADAMGLAVAMPGRSIPAMIRRVGWDLPALLDVYADVEPMLALARLARVSGVMMSVHVAGQRWALGEDPMRGRSLSVERELARAARAENGPQRDEAQGLTAWPLEGAYGAMVVVIGREMSGSSSGG